MIEPQPFLIVRDHVFETRVEPQGIPTPMLLSLGRGEAYFVAYDEPYHGVPGCWRARDDSYDPPGTVYTRVRVVRNPAYGR